MIPGYSQHEQKQVLAKQLIRLSKGIIAQKQNANNILSQREIYIQNISVKLRAICSNGEHLKKQWSLFNIIGCDSEILCFSQLVENLQVSQVNNFFRKYSRKDDNTEIGIRNLGIDNIKTDNNFKSKVSETERYNIELRKHYTKYGRQILEPMMFNKIVSDMTTKGIIPSGKGRKDIFIDIRRMINQ